MPYKFNQPRRHKIPTAEYRVTNWPDYDAALVRRGALTVWFTDEAIAEWRAPATGRRGGQPIYSALAIGDCPDNTLGVPPAAASDRRTATIHCRCARRRHRYPRSYHPQSSRCRPDSPAKRHPSDRAAEPGSGQHWSQNLRRRRMAGCEAWQSFTPTLAQAAHRHQRRYARSRGRRIDAGRCWRRIRSSGAVGTDRQ